MAAVAIGELYFDDSLPQARSEPADLGLEGETVVLQLGGGDDGVVREHGAVTGLTTSLRHAPLPANLPCPNICICNIYQFLLQFDESLPLTCVSEL